MKTKITTTANCILIALALMSGIGMINHPTSASASGGSTSGGGSPTIDNIKVSKCYYDAPTGQMLIKASSSNPTARLYAYRPDGTLQGEVQNGGGSRYGGTVMGYISYDPGSMIIVSTSGGSIQAPTTPFQI